MNNRVAPDLDMDPIYPPNTVITQPPDQGLHQQPENEQGPYQQQQNQGAMEMLQLEDQEQPPAPIGFEGISSDDPPPPEPEVLYGDKNGPTPVESPGTGGGTSAQPIGFEGPDYPDGGEEIGLKDNMESSTDAGTRAEASTEDTLFFRDGQHRIDFILAYQDSDDPKKIQKRQTFEKNLTEEGLLLETEDKQHGKTYFVKVHAPWKVLTRMAELMNIKMPIQYEALGLPNAASAVNSKTILDRFRFWEVLLHRMSSEEYDLDDTVGGCCPKIDNPFELSDDLVKPEPDYFTADFSREREKMFIIQDKDTFFTNAQRSMIVNELLMRTRYEEEKDKFGVDRLVKQGVYDAAFPLHEGKFKSEHSLLTHGPANDRHLLYETWARPGRWYFYQPLDLIRKYFGEKVGIYFTWLGFYTAMLIPASIVGLIVFIYGCATLINNDPSEEICDKSGPGNFTMCPLCDQRCSYWRLHTSCLYARVTYLFDNYATVFFAGFMAVWSTMFLEFWKRKQAEIQYDWDVASYELEEHMRPEYEARVANRKMNPVTRLMEPYMPIQMKIPRKCTSWVAILFMISCVVFAVFGVIMYRIIIVTLLYAADEEIIRTNAKITTSATAALISLVIILILNRIYGYIAVWLTDFECPRTDSDYEDSYTFKMFLFQFINYYSTIFYIAFFKGRMPTYPGSIHQVSGWPQEMCDPAGCLIELCIQLAIVMVGKQGFNNFKELMLPVILNWIRKRGSKKKEEEDPQNLYTRWEQDKDLQQTANLPLFDEYLEMVIQYGFVTIFVAAFPLAPLFALINNIIEIRLDAYKFVAQYRRPVAQRAQDIGIWYGILQGVTFIAVLSNAFIIGWTSDFVPKLVYRYIESPDGSMAGYINNSLSVFDVNDFQPQSVPDDPLIDEFGNVTYCRYSDYRYPPWNENQYEYTRMYWHVFTARLAFIIVFEHVVIFLTWLVAYLIPDVPAAVKQLMLREVFLAKEARYEAAFATIGADRESKMDSAANMA